MPTLTAHEVETIEKAILVGIHRALENLHVSLSATGQGAIDKEKLDGAMHEAKGAVHAVLASLRP